VPPAARVNRALERGRVDMRIEGARIVEYRAPLARTLKPPIYFPPGGRFCVTQGRDIWARRSRSVTTVASSGSGRDSLSLNQWYSHSMGDRVLTAE
jgi:hypothetical protein